MAYRFKFFGAALVAATLTACGGGGGSNSQPVANQDPQGFWTGSSSGSPAGTFSLGAVILENGEFYSMFSQNGVAYGVDYGTGTVSGTTISGNMQEFYIPTNSVVSGSISATFSPKNTLQGSTRYNNGVTTNFTTTYNTSYDTPASLSAITGLYTGNYYTGAPVNLSISSNGVVSGSSTSSLGTCIINGTVAPRASGKNVYNLNMNFTGNACAPGQGTASGIGVLNVINGQTYVYTVGLNQTKTNGFFWIGRKQ